jgi:hypothetical protein
MPQHNCPIVGAFFRPPAKALLASLPFGQALTVRAEPDNQHDVNAIAIWLESENIGDASQAELLESLPGFGIDLNQIMSEMEWHLGYIPRGIAAILKERSVVDGTDIPGTLSFNAKGGPEINFSTEF